MHKIAFYYLFIQMNTEWVKKKGEFEKQPICNIDNTLSRSLISQQRRGEEGAGSLYDRGKFAPFCRNFVLETLVF